jgi:hypothetical protein
MNSAAPRETDSSTKIGSFKSALAGSTHVIDKNLIAKPLSEIWRASGSTSQYSDCFVASMLPWSLTNYLIITSNWCGIRGKCFAGKFLPSDEAKARGSQKFINF